MDTVELTVRNGDRVVTDLTVEVERFVAGRGDGLVNVFAPHATAGLALLEIGAGSDADLARTLAAILPRDDELYHHRHGTRGHGADHVLPALVSPSLSIPVVDGHMTLGPWQSIVLVDTNGDNPHRTVRLSFLTG